MRDSHLPEGRERENKTRNCRHVVWRNLHCIGTHYPTPAAMRGRHRGKMVAAASAPWSAKEVVHRLVMTTSHHFPQAHTTAGDEVCADTVVTQMEDEHMWW